MGKRSYTRRSETNVDASATENKTRQSLRIKSQEAGPAKPKRKRITQEQFQALSALFQETDTPNFELREQLAKKLNMTNREVQVWFQNRRAKFNRARLQQQRQQQQQQQQQQQMQRHHQHHYQQQQHQHHLHQSEQQQPLHTVHRDGIVYVYPSWSQTQSTGVPQQLLSMSSTFPLSHAKKRGPLFPNEEDGQDRAELAPLDTQAQWRYNLGCLDEKERSPTDSVLSPSSSLSSCSPTLPLLPYPELHDNLTSLEILALAADYLQRCEEHVAKHQQQQQRQPLEVQHEHSFASSSSATSTCTTSTLTTAPITPTSAASTSFTTACSCNAPPSSNTTNGSWRPWL